MNCSQNWDVSEYTYFNPKMPFRTRLAMNQILSELDVRHYVMTTRTLYYTTVDLPLYNKFENFCGLYSDVDHTLGVTLLLMPLLILYSSSLPQNCACIDMARYDIYLNSIIPWMRMCIVHMLFKGHTLLNYLVQICSFHGTAITTCSHFCFDMKSGDFV